MSFPIKQGLFKLDMMDYHAILGIPIGSNSNEIRLRYLKIVPKLHPDTCKQASAEKREKANQILSRLVNPAYEQLTKEKLKAEHQLLLNQKAQSIVREGRQITLSTDMAKALAKGGKDLEGVYRKIITSLGNEQYRDIDKIVEKIAQISELNLVYLVFQEAQQQELKKQKISTGNSQSRFSSTTANLSNTEEGKKDTGASADGDSQQHESAINAYLRRGEEYKERGKFKEAVLELRDGLKIEPNNVDCHALLGLVYLEQKSISMAKVHIEKAWKTDPNNNIVKEAKQKLEKYTKDNKNKGKSQTNNSALGRFGKLFSSKKK